MVMLGVAIGDPRAAELAVVRDRLGLAHQDSALQHERAAHLYDEATALSGGVEAGTYRRLAQVERQLAESDRTAAAMHGACPGGNRLLELCEAAETTPDDARPLSEDHRRRRRAAHERAAVALERRARCHDETATLMEQIRRPDEADTHRQAADDNRQAAAQQRRLAVAYA